MRLSNIQLRVILPVIYRESKEHPSKEWDVILERGIRAAVARGMSGELKKILGVKWRGEGLTGSVGEAAIGEAGSAYDALDVATRPSDSTSTRVSGGVNTRA